MFNLIVIEYEQIETSMSFHFSLSKWKILKKIIELNVEILLIKMNYFTNFSRQLINKDLTIKMFILLIFNPIFMIYYEILI